MLLPGSPSTGCYLWRATTQPVSGRGPALALPLAMLVVVLADRLWADKIAVRRQVRGWASVGLTALTAVVWTGLVVQGRSGCATSPAVIGAVVCGVLAATVCAHWATRGVPVDELLPERPEKSSDQPLNQSELRATFVQLCDFVTPGPPRRSVAAVLTAAASALLLLSTLLPWRELVDPVALGPAGAEAGLLRSQLWELPYALTWAVLVAVLAAGTLALSVTDLPLVRRTAATATGALTVVGTLHSLVQLPPRLPDGVGYQPGIGAWLALLLGVLLLVLGLLPLRQLAAVAAAAVLGLVGGLLVPQAAAAAYEPEVAAGSPHRLLNLNGGQLEDPMGMRVAIGTSDPLDSIAGNLDGTPGEWLLGRTGSEGSTVFAYADGVALPQVALSHGSTPPALLGVADHRMLLLAGGAGNRPWAVLAVPLNLVSADISLSHRDPDGRYYVTPGVEVLASGTGPALTHRNADRSVVIWGGTSTWEIPAAELRPGMKLDDFLVNPGPGAPGNSVSTGPDGTVAWRTSQTGLALHRPGSGVAQLAGVAPAGCPLSRDAASSSLTVEAFAVDVRGNLWLGGSAPTAVVTPDGVLRPLPSRVAGVDSIEARPDGSVVLGVSPGGGDQVLVVPDAAASAASYPAAGEPSARCDRRKPAGGSTSYRMSVVSPVPLVDPPVDVEGQAGKAVPGTGSQLALDAGGRLVRMRVPNAAHVWAPDGQGGVWWTVAGRAKPSYQLAVHLKSGKATVLRDPLPTAPDQRGESAAAAGDLLVNAIGGGQYNFYGPTVKRLQVNGKLRALAQLPSGAIAMVLGERLIQVEPDGRETVLLGGSSTGWPVSAAGVPAAERTTDGTWFTGPDGRPWVYDGTHLTRVDGPGRVTVIAGPADGVPQAADDVTPIGTSLYFALGHDTVRLEPIR
ncbi:hypothetical protein GCM10009741_71030 [Kribbella lupini]|uniref:Uncharacterized protein n=1 Tax=Kribbella lupini TaxID=291602 RepID=A0ABN2CE29_9ACTN